jgi:hypothetical protein
MAASSGKCEEVALGNVAAVFVVKAEPPPARSKALQRGGGDPTSTCSDFAKRLTI